MARFIHAVSTPDGTRYREWSTITDTYMTDALTRDEMAEHLSGDLRAEYERRMAHELREVATRLDRAEENGTSQIGGSRGNDRWETEKCRVCGGFHHAYREPTAGELRRCRDCGERRSDHAHLPPCVETEGES